MKTSVTYEANGTQTTYNIPFDYLRNSFVKAKIGEEGTPMEYGDDYTVANRQITFDTAPTGELIIYRETPTDRLVQFVEGSVLKATDMNISTLQQLHIIEESQDWTTSNSVVFNDETGCWEGRGYRIANLADPVNAQDAVTKKYIEDTTTGYLSEMNNTKNSCISALNETKTTFENFVNTKTSEVNSLKTQAETTVTNAEGYAELAQKWAESSESPDGAEDSKSSKSWAAEAANSAASAAQYAQEAANTAAGLGNPVMSVEENNGVVTIQKADSTNNTFNVVTSVNGTTPTNGNVQINIPSVPSIATQSEAENGTNNTKIMTPLRVAQAIEYNHNNDMQIIAPSGNVSVNSRYVLNNPFPGYYVFCKAQLQINGKWGDVGFVYSDEMDGGVGIFAAQLLPDDDIIVQTGAVSVVGGSPADGNPFSHEGVEETAPCRVVVYKLGEI